MDYKTKIREIIADNLGIPVSKVIDTASFIDDLGADSLDTVELVMRFEEEYQIMISDEDVEKMITVGDAIKYIGKILKNKKEE